MGWVCSGGLWGLWALTPAEVAEQTVHVQAVNDTKQRRAAVSLRGDKRVGAIKGGLEMGWC